MWGRLSGEEEANSIGWLGWGGIEEEEGLWLGDSTNIPVGWMCKWDGRRLLFCHLAGLWGGLGKEELDSLRGFYQVGFKGLIRLGEWCGSAGWMANEDLFMGRVKKEFVSDELMVGAYWGKRWTVVSLGWLFTDILNVSTVTTSGCVILFFDWRECGAPNI